MARESRGGGRGSRPKVPGVFEYDPATVKLDTKPSELFPAYRVSKPEPPTEKEKRAVSYYINLRDHIHEGPLYTKARTRDPKPVKTYGDDHFNALHDNSSKAAVDPFDGVPRYTHRYDQKIRTVPQLSGRSFAKGLFPEELHSTLDGDDGEAVHNHINRAIKRKATMPTQTNKKPNLTPKEKENMLLEKLKSITENEEIEAEVDRDEDEDDLQEEEQDYDYDYEDDEAEMGGDYGAEQYFDGGDGEDDDGGDGGGGDDY